MGNVESVKEYLTELHRLATNDNLDRIHPWTKFLQEQVNHAVVVEKRIIAQVIVNIKIMLVIIVGKRPSAWPKYVVLRLDRNRSIREPGTTNKYGDQETILYDAIFCVKDT